MHHNLLICPVVDGRLGCFYLLASVNSATLQCMNEHLCASICVSTCFQFFGYLPRSGIAGSYGNSVFKLVVLAALGLCCSAQAVPCCAQLFLAHSCSLLRTAVPCCAQAFSSCGVRGLLSSCGGRVSHCGGFSCCRAQALGCMGFSSCDACVGLVALWNFSSPARMKPTSPALEDRFFTTRQVPTSILIRS